MKAQALASAIGITVMCASASAGFEENAARDTRVVGSQLASFGSVAGGSGCGAGGRPSPSRKRHGIAPEEPQSTLWPL